MTVTVERVPADDEDAFCELFEMLIALHRKGGYAPLDVDKTTQVAYSVVASDMALVARDEDGQAIGTLGLGVYDWWYSAETYLADQWFYVVPDHRKKEAGPALLRAARDIADAMNKLLFIIVTDPDRPVKRSKLSQMVQRAGYVPLGYQMRLR